MERWRREQQGHSVPSPLAGEEQGGGYNQPGDCYQYDTENLSLGTLSMFGIYARKQRHARHPASTPLPVPPPQGGREPCGAHLRNAPLRSL